MSETQNSAQGAQGQTIIINQPANTNGLGTAGFVLALVAIFLSWVPILNWILWTLGLILSAVGVFKKPKGLAIAGLIVSLACLILIITLIAAVAAAL